MGFIFDWLFSKRRDNSNKDDYDRPDKYWDTFESVYGNNSQDDRGHSRDSMMKNGRLRRGDGDALFDFNDEHSRQDVDIFDRDGHPDPFPFHGGMSSFFDEFRDLMRMDPFNESADPFGVPRMGPSIFGNIFDGMPSHEMMPDSNSHYSFQSHSYSRVLQPDGTVVEKKKYKDSTGREDESETIFEPNESTKPALDRPKNNDPNQKALEYNPGNMLKKPRKKNDDN